MTCDDFERVLPELEGDHNAEQAEHLRTCSSCSDLVSDLNAITDHARLLEDVEPSPRVWNGIEAALREEGLIRQPQLQLAPVVKSAPRWRFAWLVPIAAAMVFGSGLIVMHWQLRNQGVEQTTAQPPVVHAPAIQPQVLQAAATSNQNPTILPDEDQLLNAVATQAPAMRAVYESDLRSVEAYIRDAELTARNNPNDEIAQQYLMNAYEQKAMVYEMAMERALP
jgi:hypothetical protein